MRIESFSEFVSKYRKDGFHHEPRERHKEIMYHLANGNKEYFEKKDHSVSLNFSAGKLSDDPVKQYQNLIISVSAVCAHIAILCNVDGELSLSLADYYIRLTQKMTSEKEILPFFKNIYLHYCDIIKRYKNVPYTHTIKRVIECIYDNIYTPIFVNDIAKMLDMNPSYLSTVFKDETGVNLKNYIHVEKMKEAKNLMAYTKMSLTEIAAHLGYSDLSHFTRSCKAYVGITPRQLRTQDATPSLLEINLFNSNSDL